MAFVKKDRVRETSTTTGTGSITTAGAPAGYQAFGSVMSVGDTTWYAIVLPGGAWETGLGTYTGTNTLARTTVLESSNGGALVSFGAGSKDVFICQPASQAQPAFPSGTSMLFQQTSAPVYWTKQTVHNDKALRVVSGTAGFGGAGTFSSCFNTLNGVNNTTITTSTMPSHNHPGSDVNGVNAASSTPGGTAGHPVNPQAGTIALQGGDNPHSHTFNLQLQYVDLIIATKD